MLDFSRFQKFQFITFSNTNLGTYLPNFFLLIFNNLLKLIHVNLKGRYFFSNLYFSSLSAFFFVPVKTKKMINCRTLEVRFQGEMDAAY